MTFGPLSETEAAILYTEMRRADLIDGFADEPDWHSDPAPHAHRALTVTLCLVIACAIVGGAWMIF